MDDAGDTVRLAAPARRLVSLNPVITELVFALGAGDRLVGRTESCDYPAAARARAERGRVDPTQRRGGGGARARPGRALPGADHRRRRGAAPRRSASRCSRSGPTTWPTSPASHACSARCSARAGPPTRWPGPTTRRSTGCAGRGRYPRGTPGPDRARGVGPAADRARRGQLRERDGRARRRPQRLRRCFRGLRSGLPRGDRVPRAALRGHRRLDVRRARPAPRVAGGAARSARAGCSR